MVSSNTPRRLSKEISPGLPASGVSEFTMSCLSIGMSLHGGVIRRVERSCFLGLHEASIRVAALMETPVIFIWTHDAFRVGGRPHPPTCGTGSADTLVRKITNHNGRNAMLVLRPADVHETTSRGNSPSRAANPTGLILSRQNNELAGREISFQEALNADKGGYIVQDDENFNVILLASGSEVSTLVDGAKLLREDGIKDRVVSIPSEGLFRTQPEAYQEEVLPKGTNKFGLTAGLPVTLEGLVGADGAVWGLNSFGFSAPYTVLDEQLGYTGQNVYEQVKKMLK